MEQTTFDQRVKTYFDQFTSAYQQYFERAIDKDFAIDFFKKTVYQYFGNIPMQTVFFDRLTGRMLAYQKLGFTDYIIQLISAIDAVRIESKEAYDLGLTALLYEHIAMGDYTYELYLHHADQINNQSITLEKLIELEAEVAKLDTDQILDLLMKYSAIQLLLEEIEKTTTEENKEQDVSKFPTQSDPNAIMSRSQQVLFFNYLFKCAGIDKTNTDITEIARVINTMYGLSPEPVSNGEIYKKILNPIYYNTKSVTLKNLDVVQVLFEKIKLEKALQLIQEDRTELNTDKLSSKKE